jgi:alanine dehydrogenase
MNIGIPRERRPFEFRVGLSPAGVQILTQNGHQIYIEHEAGVGAGSATLNTKKPSVSLIPRQVFGRQTYCSR